MSLSTEHRLMAVHRATALRLDDISMAYLGLSPQVARQRAALNDLPFPTFRLSESVKAPILVHVTDLATHIDVQHEKATESWQHSQP
jgi:hypothetical protein